MRGNKKLGGNNVGSIGVGSLIIFIAIMLVAGIASNVIIQTMGTLQQQARKTGTETMHHVATGIQVTFATGKTDAEKNWITQLAVFISPCAGSESIDLNSTYVRLSNTAKTVVLTYNNACYNNSPSNGLFESVNMSDLESADFGIIVISDSDSSCTVSSPNLNKQDKVALMINTSACFGNGLGKRTEITGGVYPEFGTAGTVGFTTPASFVETIINLQ